MSSSFSKRSSIARIPAPEVATGDTAHAVSSAQDPIDRGTLPSPEALFAQPLFLMVNSLETGGTERQFVQVARSLISRNDAVHLGCLLNKGAFSNDLPDVAHFDLGGSLYRLQSVRARLRLSRHLLKLGVRVAHAFDFYTNLTLIPAAKLAGVRVIGSHRQLGNLLTTAQFRVQLAMFHLCDAVLCNSHAAAETLLQAGLPRRKIVVIGNALPDAAFLEKDAVPPRQIGTLRVGMIARMNAEYKNHRIFLRAARLTAEKIANIEFILVGDGPLRCDLEHEAHVLGLGHRVRFLGDRRDVTAVLRSLDLSIIPSSSESLSNVMLESMAAGVPVIATSVGGNIELAADERAFLVPPGNEHALAQAIIRLCTNPQLSSETATRARQFVRQNFGAEQICQQYLDLYRSVIDPEKQTVPTTHSARTARHPALRVAMVAPSLRYVGGQAVQADLLMRNWGNDFDVSILFVPVDPKFPFGLQWAEKIPFLRTIVRAPIYFSHLWSNLRNVDIVHIFSASYTSFLLAPLPAWFVARRLEKKTIINYRSGEARNHLTHSQIARHVLGHADRVVVPSGYLAHVFREFAVSAEIVPNIIDLSQFQFRTRSPLRPHLLCTRGFHPYYGIDVVIRAFAEVQEHFPEAQLDLVGSGSLESDIRQLVKHLNLRNVHFLGVASRQEIGRIYDRADIFINASNLDNMPVSVLEAFASGTPVVTTNPEGMPYVVTHERTGLLSPVGDSNALAANILRLLREPELAASLAQNALQESSRYHWPAVRNQWLRIYSELAAADKNTTGKSQNPAPPPSVHTVDYDLVSTNHQ